MFIKCFCLLDDVCLDIGEGLAHWVGDVVDEVHWGVGEADGFQEPAGEKRIETGGEHAGDADAIAAVHVLIEAGGVLENEVARQIGPAALGFDEAEIDEIPRHGKGHLPWQMIQAHAFEGLEIAAALDEETEVVVVLRHEAKVQAVGVFAVAAEVEIQRGGKADGGGVV